MANEVSRAAHGTILHVIAQLMLTLSGYVVVVVVTYGLGDANYFVYNVIYSFLMSVELIVVWGIPGATSRLIADGRDADGRIRATGLWLVAGLCLAAFALLWSIAPWVAALLGVATHVDLLRIAILDIPGYGIYFLLAQTLNGRRDFLGQTLGMILYALAKIGGAVFMLFHGLTIANALIANIVATLVGLAWVLFRGGRPALHAHREAVRPILGLAGAVATITLGTQVLLNLDLWMLGHFQTAAEQASGGWYGAAKNLARFPNLVAFVMNAVLVPSIAHACARGDLATASRITRGSTRFLALTLLPASALLIAEAGPLMRLVFPQQFAGGDVYLQWLTLANGLLLTFGSTLVSVLVATRHQKEGALVALGAIVPGLVAGLLLIPAQRALGAAMAAAIMTGCFVLLGSWRLHRRVGGFIELPVLLKSAAVTALVVALGRLWTASGPLLLAELVLLAGVYYGLCWLLKLVSVDELRALLGGTPAAGAR